MSRRWRVYAVALALAAGTSLRGQEPDLRTPTFRAGTTLVEFTVVATDRNGQPVADLKQEDISILQGGKPRPIAFFRFEGGAFGPDAAELRRVKLPTPEETAVSDAAANGNEAKPAASDEPTAELALSSTEGEPAA